MCDLHVLPELANGLVGHHSVQLGLSSWSKFLEVRWYAVVEEVRGSVSLSWLNVAVLCTISEALTISKLEGTLSWALVNTDSPESNLAIGLIHHVVSITIVDGIVRVAANLAGSVDTSDQGFVVTLGEANNRHGDHSNNECNEHAAESWIGDLSVPAANIAVSDLRVSGKAIAVDGSRVLLSLAFNLV